MPRGFAFEAGDMYRRATIQGEETTLTETTHLRVRSPVPARVVIIKDGATFTTASDVTDKEFGVRERGVYRAEIYLPQLGDRLWILSNPIYVR